MATSKIRQSPKLPAEKRREQLLRSAHRCFREQGYRGTSTEEIARHAGLTKGALYFHFKNKEEILFALLKMMVEDYRAAFNALQYGRISPSDIVRVSMHTKNRFKCHEFRSMLEIYGQAMRNGRIRRFLNEQYRKQIKYVAAGFDPAYCLSRREAEQVAVMVLSMCDGLIVRRSLNESEVDMKIQLKLLRELFNLVKSRKSPGRKVKP